MDCQDQWVSEGRRGGRGLLDLMGSLVKPAERVNQERLDPRGERVNLDQRE